MAYQEVNSLDADKVIGLGGKNKETRKDNPTQVEGYYLGSKKIASRKAKLGYSYIHVFQTEDGNVGVWGKTDLDRKVLSVTPGNMTMVTFSGMRPTPNGDMFTFKVKHDPDNSIEVAAQVEQAPTGADSTHYSSNDDYTKDEEEEETPPVQIASQNKTQELLNRHKRKVS